LEEEKYLVIRTPILDTTQFKKKFPTHGYLGKSKHGVYYTAVHGYHLQVWVLRTKVESGPTPEWEPKHQADLEPHFKSYYDRRSIGGTTQECFILESEDRPGDYEWDSSDDNITDEGEIKRDYKARYRALDFLGYHPYKDIAFVGNRFHVFAYYLDSSKFMYLGSPYPSFLDKHSRRFLPILESFIYTPCMDDLLPVQNDA
jgi:hypothetical protein